MSVSTPVALAVVGLYSAYHLTENYSIAPKVYGDRLELSNLAVILAFVVGATIGGIIGGAVVALPIAALYRVIENVWLRGTWAGTRSTPTGASNTAPGRRPLGLLPSGLDPPPAIFL